MVFLFRKAVKATAVLFPLLGLIHIIFLVNPGFEGNALRAYMIVPPILHSIQVNSATAIYHLLLTQSCL